MIINLTIISFVILPIMIKVFDKGIFWIWRNNKTISNHFFHKLDFNTTFFPYLLNFFEEKLIIAINT